LLSPSASIVRYVLLFYLSLFYCIFGALIFLIIGVDGLLGAFVSFILLLGYAIMISILPANILQGALGYPVLIRQCEGCGDDFAKPVTGL
jgi:hypothetical protein